MNNTKQQIFGKYYLLQEIAAGGMAEIYLARPADSEANGRIFILKRILPQVTQDPEFIRMFQSEIQVSMGFNHPNLVQIFDFGKAEGKHFIAMEYIEGKNLRELTLKFISMGQMIPIAASVELIAQACAGLGYAHRYKNHVTGEALNIVHRDVSPQNILVSYDGIVKIIDFGIAKSESTHADKTRAGSIKGKLSYLSPEQLYQQELDGRSDIFSLGAVLWELLAGQKLFHQIGQSDMGILEAIAHCENVITAPSNFNDLVSAELDQIVLRALAKDRENRYGSMLEFQRALQEYLKFLQPGYDSHHLGLTIKDMFESEMDEDRSRIKLLNHQAQLALESDERTQRISAQPAAQVSQAPKVAQEAPKPKAPVTQTQVPPPARNKTATQIPRAPRANPADAAMQAKAQNDAAAGAELAEVTGDHNIEDIPGLTMERMPPPQNFHAQHAYNYSQGSGPHYMQGDYAQQPQVIYMHEPVGGKKVKEQFYIKLTFGRALMALFYAATLLVLRLDHDQVVMNAIFGHWDGQAALAEKVAPVTVLPVAKTPDLALYDDTVSEQVAEGEQYARTHLPLVAERRARMAKGTARAVANTQPVAQAVPSKSVMLRIHLVRKSGPAATSIMVNQSKLDLKRPTIQVQTNQLFWVQVQRKNGRPLMKSVQLKPELIGMANSYSLDVYLY